MDLWAIGRYDLHLSENDFWNLTLREYSALLQRHNQNLDWQDYQSSKFCALLFNIYRDPKKSKALSPQDFMIQKTKITRKLHQTPDDMLNVLRQWNAAL